MYCLLRGGDDELGAAKSAYLSRGGWLTGFYPRVSAHVVRLIPVTTKHGGILVKINAAGFNHVLRGHS